MDMNKTVLLGLAAVMLAAPASAQASPRHVMAATKSAAASGRAAPSTQVFVDKAAIANMFAVKAAKLVERKGAPRPETQFARHVIRDDSKAEDRLARLVTSGSVKATLPVQVDAAQLHRLDKLGKLSGKRFDRSYAKLQKNGRQQTIAMYRAYAQKGDSPVLRRWARQVLPTLKHHRQMAKRLD